MTEIIYVVVRIWQESRYSPRIPSLSVWVEQLEATGPIGLKPALYTLGDWG